MRFICRDANDPSYLLIADITFEITDAMYRKGMRNGNYWLIHVAWAKV